MISLLLDYGFIDHGIKTTNAGNEKVLVRKLNREFNKIFPKHTFPFISKNVNVFITPIYPSYHTNLLPDSILRTETPTNFTENEPFRNAISKVYISRSITRDLYRGDVIIFYRTGGYYEGVITTLGIVEEMHDSIPNESKFIELCGKRSVFSAKELLEWWNYKPKYRPFIVNFLYAYSLPKRLNCKWLIDQGVFKNIESVPRGFEKISKEQFSFILKGSGSDESIIVN